MKKRIEDSRKPSKEKYLYYILTFFFSLIFTLIGSNELSSVFTWCTFCVVIKEQRSFVPEQCCLTNGWITFIQTQLKVQIQALSTYNVYLEPPWFMYYLPRCTFNRPAWVFASWDTYQERKENKHTDGHKILINNFASFVECIQYILSRSFHILRFIKNELKLFRSLQFRKIFWNEQFAYPRSS